jgi:hypothetical protein
MITYQNYSQTDLGAALAGVSFGPLDLDKLWAERKTSEEWARMEEEGPVTLPTVNPKDVQNELLSLRQTRLPKTGSCHEL